MTDIEKSPKFLDHFTQKAQEDDRHSNDTLIWIFVLLLVACILYPPMIFVFLLAAVAGVLVTLFPPKRE